MLISRVNLTRLPTISREVIRLALVVIAFSLAITAIKAVIAGLVVAGLIFRTQQTIGLLALGGLLTLIATFPLVGVSLVLILIVIVIAKKASKGRKELPAIEDYPHR